MTSPQTPPSNSLIDTRQGEDEEIKAALFEAANNLPKENTKVQKGSREIVVKGVESFILLNKERQNMRLQINDLNDEREKLEESEPDVDKRNAAQKIINDKVGNILEKMKESLIEILSLESDFRKQMETSPKIKEWMEKRKFKPEKKLNEMEKALRNEAPYFHTYEEVGGHIFHNMIEKQRKEMEERSPVKKLKGVLNLFGDNVPKNESSVPEKFAVAPADQNSVTLATTIPARMKDEPSKSSPKIVG